MSFSIIAAIGKNRELGKAGGLVWRLPEDMKYFRETTEGHAVLMGHKTFDSLPGKLPNRKNIVVSRGEIPGADEVVHDLSAFIEEHKGDKEEIFVIGGGMLYWEMLKHCDKLYLTEVEAEDPAADTFFPEFDRGEYERTEVKKGADNGLKYTFVVYTRKN